MAADLTTSPLAAPPPESDFGQEYSLTAALSKLVRDYSLGVGLFKEFIQNADDAEATIIRFILDQRSPATRAFHNPKLANLAGPALLVWNNASFKDQDIKNIQSLGDSQKVLKPASTGKFGLGFNTCYNITDYPLLLTGARIYLFDPHKTASDYPEGSRPGKCWPLSSQLWSESADLLNPFQLLGLSPGQSDFSGTAFRLPLRSSDHNHINGQIKTDLVAPGKIHELFQEFARFSPSILLFLKHLLRIEFLIASSAGIPTSVVHIVETVNEEIVRTGRGIVNSAIKSDIPATLKHLRAQPGNSITSCFKHSVKVSSAGAPTAYDWLVCTGLFRGPDDRLLNSAAELWDRKEKAIPWAGCASLIPTTEKPLPDECQGNVFCFLPLPDALGGCRLPVHINGFFDVDTSRKGLTHEATATDSVERLRAQWNRQLLVDGAATACGQMFVKILELNPALDPKAFYSLWLNPSQDFPPPLDSFAQALYAKLAPLKLLRSSASTWQPSAELRLVGADLSPPLVAEKWAKIPNPEIPEHILTGFTKAGNSIPSLAATELRAFLKTDKDIDCLPEKAGRPVLQKREWLISLANAAFKDAQGPAFSGLPLLLLADGTLHTIGHLGRLAYLAGPAERQIFSQSPQWFLDSDYAKLTAFPEIQSAQVLQMTPEHVLAHLAALLAKEADKHFVTWTPGGSAPPNETWLTSVFQFFLDQPASWSPDADLLSKPCIVPDQHNRLWPCGNNLTPLLVPANLDPRLRGALQALAVQLATAGPQLLKLIEAFAARFAKIWSVTPRDLADTLHESRGAWGAKLLKYDAPTCEPILQFFASEESLQSFRTPAIDRSEKLRELPIFPCQNGDLVAIKGNQCYISAEVTPPAVALPTKLLRPGTWKNLLVALKVKSLGPRAIIDEVILPNYHALNQQEQLKALVWIRDHLEEALTETAAEKDELLSALQSAKLILGSNSVLSECRHLYVPNSKTIRDVLGDLAITPKPDLYEEGWDRWLPLFERLGINKTPRPQDLARHIDKLKEAFQAPGGSQPSSASENLGATEQQLISVLQHIVQNWPLLRAGQIDLAGGENISFKDFLRGRPWCPPLRGASSLRHLLIAPEPPAQLFPLAQLYPPALGHLVASLNHLLPIEQRDTIPEAIREILPEVVTPPVATVTAHFSKLLVTLNENGPPDVKAIRTPLHRIYSYFGSLAGSDPQSVQTHFAALDCVYVPADNRFRKPKDVFRDAVSFASPWWAQAYFGNAEIEAGLAVLGRKEKPDLADLCRLTREINDSATEPLSDEEAAQFIRILFRIEELLPDQDPLPDLCLLDRDGCTVLPTRLFFHDATWLDEKLADSPVHLHHPQLPLKLIERLDLKRLSDHITIEPEGEWPQSQNPGFLGQCKIIEDLLKTQEFLDGLRRILSRGAIVTKEFDLDWIPQIHISAVQSLQCSHYVSDGGEKQFLIKDEELFFYDPPESGDYVLTLSEAGADVLYEQVAIALQRWLGADDLKDLSPLAKILQCPPDRIESVLNKLRISKLAGVELPVEEEPGTEDRKDPFFEQQDTDKEPDDKPEDAPHGGKHPPKGGNDQRQDVPPNKPLGGAGRGRPGGLPGGGRAGPSSRPHGRPPHRPDQKPKGRLLSYPATDAQRKTKEREQDPADDHLPANKEIGDWAVHWVVQFEIQQGRRPDPTNHVSNLPGFDILSKEKGLAPPRYIEVKGIGGSWDLDGVPVYPTQLDFARQHGDQFWLYVVEHAREPASVRIHTIQNPVSKITQYRFDSGWNTVAAPTNVFKPALPAVGIRIQWRQDGNIRCGTIVGVGTMLLQVELDNELHTRTGVPNRPLQFELLP